MASRQQLSSALVPTCQAKPWKFLWSLTGCQRRTPCQVGSKLQKEGGHGQRRRDPCSRVIDPHRPMDRVLWHGAGGTWSTFPGVHHPQIQGPNDTLSTWSEGILFLPLPSGGELKAILAPTRPSSPKYLFKGEKKKLKVFQILSFLPCPIPHKANGCGRRREPTFLPFE